MRTELIAVAAASLVLCSAGCGKRSAPRDSGTREPGGIVAITVNVKGMTKALEIT
jgi:hypothetical protein